MPSPQLIFGASFFGHIWNKNDLPLLLEALKSTEISRIETAAVYPIVDPGASEKLIGDAGFSRHLAVDTKIKYNTTGGGGTLTADAIESSIEQSIQSLKTPKLGLLYIHGPDRTTPLVDQIAALDAQHKRGRFTTLGLGNLDAAMLTEWLEISASKGFIKPSIYQGQYNLLCRTYENEVLPILRRHGIPFAAAAPLAGGFLTGKLTFSKGEDDLKGTRLDPEDPNSAFIRYWYDKTAMHSAVTRLVKLCEEHEVSLMSAALRWVLFHSEIGKTEGDAVVIGPRNIAQLEGYLDAVASGPLPKELADGTSSLWDEEHLRAEAASIVSF